MIKYLNNSNDLFVNVAISNQYDAFSDDDFSDDNISEFDNDKSPYDKNSGDGDDEAVIIKVSRTTASIEIAHNK